MPTTTSRPPIACTTSRSSTRRAASAARPACSSSSRARRPALVAVIGDLVIVDDEDERLVADRDRPVPRRGRPRGRRGHLADLETTDELVEFYDPTDVFGDLADALAEAFPSVAPELAGARRGRGRGRRGRRRDAPTGDDGDEADAAEDEPTRDHAAHGCGAGREPGDPAGPVAAVVPRPGASRPGSRAGQFVHVRPGDLSGMVLRRPFSLNTTDAATGIVTIHFRVIGRGTDWFTRLRPGDAIDMLGPLGRPFEVDPRSQNLLLIAGGLGIAGVRMLADEAIRDGRRVTLLFGAASAREVYPSNLLPDEVEYIVATDDGSLGHHGYVTDLIPEYEAWADQAFACGPAGDARRSWPVSPPGGAIAWASPSSAASAGPARSDPPGSPAARRKAFLQVSMEQNMGCAVGACLGCVVMSHERAAAAGLSRGPGLRRRRSSMGEHLAMTTRRCGRRGRADRRPDAWTWVVGARPAEPDPRRLGHVRLRHRVRRRRRRRPARRDLLQGDDAQGRGSAIRRRG